MIHASPALRVVRPSLIACARRAGRRVARGRARGPALAALVAFVAACGTTVSPVPSVTGSLPPTGQATGGSGCPVAAQSGALRSNTLVDLETRSDGLNDFVTLTLGDPATNPAGTGTGELRAAEPPFVAGASGAEIEVLGAHHVDVKLTEMAITDDAGNPTYVGPTSLKPAMLALKQVEQTEAFEGVYAFVIGYDGNGCVSLASDPATKTVTITIGH
ncbi:MAG: hypothetical protein HYX57_11405 [Chloroflexi bacterium]|nr:hypothetical protein [Chloroflexota bacterium]